MNTRFSFSFIRHLQTRRQGGFALAIALCLGLVVLVVGATMMIRAQSDQSKVVSQELTNQAMAATEAGAVQYMNFLNSNRGLIPYPSCVSQDATTGACSDASTVKSWVNASVASSNLEGIGAGTSPVAVGGTTSCSSSVGGGGTPPANYQSVASSTISSNWANSNSSSGWKDLPNNKGKYRLVSYNPSYSNVNDVKTVNSAKLIIEGQSGGGSNTGKARVEFTVPVTAATVPATGSTTTSNNFPGLWAKSFKFGNNNSANAQVWDSSGCLSGSLAMPDDQILNYTSQNINVLPSNPLELASGVTDTASANNGNKRLFDGTIYRTSNSSANPLPKVSKSQDFPSLPGGGTYPTTSTPALVYGPSTTTTGTVTENSLDCSSLSNVTLPRAAGQGGATVADKSSNNVAYGTAPLNATYVYRCSGGMSIGGSDVTLGVSGKETLVFYVNGTFNASANGGIFPVKSSTDNTWSRGIFYIKNDAQVKANGNVGRLLAPYALQFYVYNSGNMNPGFDMGGNGSLYAFVFAPTSIGLSKGTEDLAGALWIKSYEVDGNNKVWQAIFDDTQLMVDLSDGGSVTTYNLDGQPSSWKRTSTN